MKKERSTACSIATVSNCVQIKQLKKTLWVVVSSIKPSMKAFTGRELNCSSSLWFAQCALPPAKISLASHWMARTMAIITLLLKVTNSINSVREGGLWQHGQDDCRCTSLHLHWRKLSRLFCAIMIATDGRLAGPCLMKTSKPTMKECYCNKRTLRRELIDHSDRFAVTCALFTLLLFPVLLRFVSAIGHCH